MTFLNIAYMNIQGQTGLDFSKQVQIEHFLKTYNIDILHCQEINVVSESFESCDFVLNNFTLISNNANNKYGTCSIISNCLQPTNV